MAICNYLAPNGEKSILADQLLQRFGPDVTARMWNYARAHMDQYTEFDQNGEPVYTEVMDQDQPAKLAQIQAVQHKIDNDLPAEVARMVSVLGKVPVNILGRDDLYLSMKDVLKTVGVKDPLLVNWAGINQGIVGHPKSIQSTEQLTKLVEKTYAKRQKPEQYVELKVNPLAAESFKEWKAALDKFPVVFKDLMLKHALKFITNPDRRSKYVLQLSPAALTATYGILMNKPHEANRLGKLYDLEVLKTVSDSVGHEPSASGRGYWVHVPRTPLNNVDEYAVNLELLRKLSPSTWCTATTLTDHYLQQYDNHILIVDGVTVAGVEVSEQTNSKGQRTVNEVTSRANNGTASIDHLDDTLAFFEKHNLDTNNSTLQRAIEDKANGIDDEKNVESRYEEDDYDPWEQHAEDDPRYYGPDFDAYIEERQAEMEREEQLFRINVEGLDSVEYALSYFRNRPEALRYFGNLADHLRNNEEIATEAVEYNPHNVQYIDSTLPFYLSLVLNALRRDGYIYDQLSAETQRHPYVQVIRQEFQDSLESGREQAQLQADDDLPFSKTTNNLIQGYYDARNDKVVVVAPNISVDEAAKVAIHEVAHRGMLRMAKDLGGVEQLHDALSASEKQLMEKMPNLLARTGHADLAALMVDYGFTTDSKEGKVKLLMELAARWAESLVDKPKPSWWKELLQKIGDWIKQFTGKTLNEQEVDELVGGFVKHGTDKLVPNVELPVYKAPVAPTHTFTQIAFIGENVNRLTGERVDTDAIIADLTKLYNKARENPTIRFEVPYERISDTTKQMNGYTTKELAGMVDQMGEIPANVHFTLSFYQVMNNLATNIASDYVLEDQTTRQLKNLAGTVMDQQRDQLFIPILDEEGKQTGNFDPVKQVQAVDTVMFMLHQKLRASPDMSPIAALHYTLKVFNAKAAQYAEKGNELQAKNYQEIVNSFAFRQESGRASITGLVLNQMEGYGLIVKNKDKVLMAMEENLRNLKKATGNLVENIDLDLDDYSNALRPVDESTLTEQELELKEGTALRDYSDVVFQLDPRDTASWRLKMYIANLRQEQLVRDEKDNVVRTEGIVQTEVVKNYLDMSTLVNFDDAYEKVMGLLADSKRDYDSYLQKLQDNAHLNPVFQTLATKLMHETTDQSMRNEFVKVMSTHYQKYLMVTHSAEKQENGTTRWVLNPFDANRSSQVNQLMENWKEAQKVSGAMTIKNGNRAIDVQKMKTKPVAWVRVFNLLYNKLNSQTRTELRDPQISAGIVAEIEEQLAIANPKLSVESLLARPDVYAREWIKEMLATHGIEFTTEMADELMTRTAYHMKGTKLSPSKGGLFGFLADGRPAGVLSVFVWKAAGLNAEYDASDDVTSDQALEAATLNNPLHSESTATRILARIAANHTELLSSPSHRDGEGKVKFDYILNNALSLKGNDLLTSETASFLNDQAEPAQDVVIKKGNVLLSHWVKSATDREKASITMLDSLKAAWAQKGTVRTGMSDREQVFMSLALFQNRGKDLAHYLSLTHSDKTMTPVFTNFPRFNTGGVDRPGKEIQAALSKLFMSELNRIRKHWDTPFNHAQYQIGKRLFFKFPQFNYEFLKATMQAGTLVNVGEESPRALTQSDIDSVWIGTGDTRRIADTLNPAGLKLVAGMLREHIANLTSEALQTWEKAGIIDPKEHTYKFDTQYVNNLLKDQQGINWPVQNIKTENGWLRQWTMDNGEIAGKKQLYDAVTVVAAREYAVNSFLVAGSMTDLAFGDPAQAAKFKKSDVENGILKVGRSAAIVAATLQEFSKRLAKDIAPGQDGNWSKPNYKTITIADVKTNDSYIRDGKIKKAYIDVDGTDAQEFTTVAEHLEVMYAHGKVTKKVYDEMMALIPTGEQAGNFFEFTDAAHLAVIMQPAKPVYVGTRPQEQGAEFHDYIKSSSYVLYPPFTQHFEIEHLRIQMEKQGIARANYLSAQKMGGPLKAITVFDADGHYIAPDGEHEDWVNATQVLSRSGFRIQQEVPYDEDKEAIKALTQMNKLLVEGITNMPNTKFTVAGVGQLDGTGIRDLKEGIRIEMLKRNLDKFHKEVGYVNGTFKDLSKLLAKLEDAARERGYSENEISAIKYLVKDLDGSLVLDIPMMYSSAAEKFEGTVMSLIKGIVQMKVPGKSYVQASSVGLTGRRDRRTVESMTEAEKSGIVWAEGYDATTPLRTMQLNEDGTVTPAQVLAPFNFFVTDPVSGKKVKANIQDYLVPGTNVLDHSKVPKELLQLVGARIPNQGHNSMLAMEIVGFTPDNMGDIMFVPSAITRQMGADFDVDKIYTYKRAYVQTENGFGIDGHLQAEDSPLSDATDAQLTTKYFDVHWGVLTNKDMYQRILNPLDKQDLAEEAKLLTKPKEGFHNYFSPFSQLSDFQSGKYAKQLVALSALSVNFNAIVQDKNLHLGNMLPNFNEEGMFVGMVPEREYITFYDDNGHKIDLTNLSGYATSEYDGESRSKQDNFTTLESGFLDNAKNRIVDHLNLTPDTYKAAAALVQLETKGDKPRAVNLTYVTRLLTQPVLMEFSRMMADGNDGMSRSFSGNLKEDTIAALKEKYQPKDMPVKAGEENMEVKLPVFQLSPANMLEQLSHPTAEGQLAALLAFEQLDAAGTRMMELQSLFNQDTNGAGQNLLTALDKTVKMNNLHKQNSTGILNERSLAGNSEQMEAFRATVYTANNVLGALLPYEAFTISSKLTPSVFDVFRQQMLVPQITVDTQKKMIKALKSYVYSSIHSLWPDAHAERFRLLYNIDGNVSLAQRVFAAKATEWGRNNAFIKQLDPVIGGTTNSPDFVNFNSAKAAMTNDSVTTTAMMEILQSPDAEIKRLGEDLVRYAYLTGGNLDAGTYVAKIPTSYLVATDFGHDLRDANTNLIRYARSTSFVQQFFQHNPDKAAQVDESVFPKKGERGYEDVFTLPPIGDKDQLTKLITRDAKGDQSYVRIIGHRSAKENKMILYFRKPGIDNTYIRVDTLGNKYTDEYNGSAGIGVRSIFQENRSNTSFLADPTPDRSLTLQTRELQTVLEDKDNMMSNFGMPVNGGDIRVAHDVMASIAQDDQVHASLRTVADILNKTGEVDIAYEGISALYGAVKPFSIGYGADKNIDGRYNAITRVLELSRNLKNRNNAAETMLHEFLHHRTSAMILMAGFSTTEHRKWQDLSGETQDHIRATVDKFNAQHPEVEKMLSRLDAVRYQSYTEFRRRMTGQLGENEFKQMLADIAEGELYSDNHRILYALSNLNELVSHSLTSAPVAAYLNTVQVKGNKTLLEHIWDTLAGLLESFARSMGVEVKDGSALKEAITLSLKLATLNSDRDTNISFQDAIDTNTTMVLDTERAALEAKDTLEQSFEKIVELVPTGNSYDLKPRTRTKWDETIPEHTQRIMSKLDEQYRQLQQVQVDKSTTAGKQLAQEINIKKRTIKADIDLLADQKRLETVQEVGRKQIQWVRNTMSKPNPTDQEVMIAYNTLDVWANVISTWYNGESAAEGVDDGLGQLVKDAKYLQNTEWLNKAEKTFNAIALRKGIRLSSADYREALKEMGGGTQQFRSLERAGAALTSTIALVGKDSLEQRDEAVRRNANRAQALEEDMKQVAGKLGISVEELYKSFLQENEDKTAWGLVKRYSSEWYSFEQKLSDDLTYNLSKVKTEQNPDLRKKAAKAVFKKHWAKLNKTVVFVDTTKFFDKETGELLDNEDVVSELALLIRTVGSLEHANELVDKAQAKYTQYLEDKSLAFAYYDEMKLTPEELAAVVLTDEERKGSRAAQAVARKAHEDALLAEKITQEKDNWIGHHSPNEFFTAKYTSHPTLGFGSVDYAVMAPRATEKSFYDDKYHAILADTDKTRLYNEVLAMRNDLMKGLPDYVLRDMGEDYLPNLTVELKHSILADLGKLKPGILAKTVFESVTMTKGQIEHSKLDPAIALPPVDRAEIHRLVTPDEIKERQAQIAGWSTDLPQVLERFGRIALHYKHTSKVLDAVNLGETILTDINKARLDKTLEGEALTRTIDAVKYWKDAMIYGRAKKIEMDSARPVQLKGQVALSKEVLKLTARRDAIVEEIVNTGTTPELDQELAKINARLEEIAKGDRFFVGSKLGDKLISYNQMRTLAFNPVAAVSNLSFGLMSAFIHANGRLDYTPKAFLQGMAEMRHAQKKYFSLGKVEDADSRKIMNAMERANIMSELQNGSYGESNMETHKKSALRTAVSPLNWQFSGDYYVKGAMMIAMMKTQMVDVVEDGVAKTISLWDATGENGYWDEQKYGPAEAWSSEDTGKQKDWNRFKLKMKTVSTAVFGNQDNNSPLFFKNKILGRLLGQFRLSWFPEGIATRFQKQHTDNGLGREVKGRWITYHNLGYRNSAMILAKQLLSTLPGVKMDAFEGVTNKKQQNISELDKENMRKNFAGLATTAAFAITMLLAKALWMPDEAEKKRRRAAGLSVHKPEVMMTINLLTRNYQDLMLYSSPSVFDTVLGNPVPAMASVTQAIKLFNMTTHLVSNDPKKYKKWRRAAMNTVPGLIQANKLETMVTKDISLVK